MKTKSILIVDDHALFADSLKQLIESFNEYRVTKVLRNGKELVEYLKLSNPLPDLILLDMKMPLMDGKATMKWLKVNYPALKVLVLSMDDDEFNIIQMLREGARGYLLKNAESAEFKEALSSVVNGGFYNNDLVTHSLLNRFVYSAEKEHLLHEREIEFLKLVCTERTYKEIAADMFLSPKTIDGYRESLFKKLNVKSRVGLVMYAIREGYVKT